MLFFYPCYSHCQNQIFLHQFELEQCCCFSSMVPVDYNKLFQKLKEIYEFVVVPNFTTKYYYPSKEARKSPQFRRL